MICSIRDDQSKSIYLRPLRMYSPPFNLHCTRFHIPPHGYFVLQGTSILSRSLIIPTLNLALQRLLHEAQRLRNSP